MMAYPVAILRFATHELPSIDRAAMRSTSPLRPWSKYSTTAL